MADAANLHLAVTGSSGLIGRALVRSLEADGHRVTRVVRRSAGPGEIAWDPLQGRLDPARLEGVDAVVHLAGENIGTRWTASRKARIRDSRVGGTRLLSQTLARLKRPPRVLLSASAVGIYGNRGDQVLTETSEPGDPARDFLVLVCLEWESAAAPARAAGIRLVHSRFGVVLSQEGGALKKLLPPFRFGMGGRLGSGSQWMSWISIRDAIGALGHSLTDETVRGPVNLTAPGPVTNRDFTRTLARVLHRPALVPVPAAALRLALGEMADSALLSSVRVAPQRLLESGYRFRDPDLEGALRHILGGGSGGSFQA